MVNPKQEPANVVIVGSGIAGLTAAIYTARASLNPVVIEGSEPGGQLTLTSEVENYPGFPEGIQGPDLVANMRQQAEKFGATFRSVDVEGSRISREGQEPITLKLSGGETLSTHTLIVAAGARARMLGLAGEEKFMGRGLSTCATCDGAFYKNRVVGVVGGGDSAMEEATFLTRFAKEVHVIHRRDTLRASKIMQDRAHSKANLAFIWNSAVKALKSDGRFLTGITLENVATGEEQEMALDGLFIAIGHVPNTEWLEGQLETDAMGYLVHEPGTSETKLPGVFVAGDVADHVYQQAVTAAGTGCMAALDAEEYLALKGLA